MSITFTVIYPAQHGHRPPADVVEKLRAMGLSLAGRLGFREGVLGELAVTVHDQDEPMVFGGIGPDYIIEPRFAIHIQDPWRWRPDVQAYDNEADELLPFWSELEAMVGSPLKQVTYKW